MRTVTQRAVLWAVITCAAYSLVVSWLHFANATSFPRHRVESPLFILSVLAAIAVALLHGSPQADEVRATSLHRAARLLIALGGSLLLYWPALSVGWLSDDYVLGHWAISQNWVPSDFEFVRPLPLIIWNGVLRLGGPPALHATLLLLHGLNAFLVGELATLWNLGGIGAWIAAGVFLVWPTHVEPVVWSSGLFDVVSTSCSLGLLTLFARRGSPLAQLLAGLPLCAAALLSKESALAIPLLLLVATAPNWQRERWSRAQLSAAGLVVVMSLGYAIWRLFIRPHAAAAVLPEFSRYALKEFASRTVGGLAVPFSSATIASHPALAACFASLPLALGVGMLAHAGRRAPEHVAAVSGLVWTLLAALPSLGFLYIDGTLSGSRYLYLPAVGWALYLSAASTYLIQRRVARVPVAVIMLGAVLLAASQARIVMGDWTRASAIRDEWLARAAYAISHNGCSTATFQGVPEMSGAAHLFRNGFPEAIAERGLYRIGGPACSLRWNGNSFVVE